MTIETANLTDEELLHIINDEHRVVLMPVIIIFGLEAVFGLVGNTLTLYVFYFRYKECNFRYFVICMALVDFISCLTTIPGSMVTQILWFDYQFPWICKARNYFNLFTACSEAALLTAIALDRYRKVCKPLQWQIKHRQALYACVGIFSVSAILAVPMPIFWGIRTSTTMFGDRNITVTLCEKDEKYLDTVYPQATVSLNGCLVFLSLILMSVLYILIVKQFASTHSEVSRRESVQTNNRTTGIIQDCVRSDHDSGNEIDSAEDSNAKPIEIAKSNKTGNKFKSVLLGKARRKTMIGLYLSVIFIFTTFLFWLLLSIVATGVLETFNNREKAAYTFFLWLYLINHVINPVLYGLMDTRFRAEIRRLKDVVSKRCVCV